MVEKDSVSREEFESLQEKNALLEAQLVAYRQNHTSCSDNLDSMRESLNSLQELLVKCRAQLSLSTVQTSTSQESTACSTSSPKEESSKPLDKETTWTAVSQDNSTNVALRNEIGLLKTQLDIFKSNFAEERMARLAAVAEKNRLACELQQLQHQNRSLIVEALNVQTEQQNYSRRCSRMSQESEEAVTNEAPQQLGAEDDSYQAERKSTSYCKHCNGFFGDIYSLETHIDECPAY